MILTECIQYKIVVDNALSLWIDVAMVLITLCSAGYAIRAYTHQRDRGRKVLSCELASHYANVILEKYTFISSVYGAAGVDQIIKDHISFNNMCDFDKVELDKLLAGSDITASDLISKMRDVDPLIILNSKIARACSVTEQNTIRTSYISINKETNQIEIRNAALLRNDLFQQIQTLLNQLECFCMNCRYSIADEEVLYQSLHQTFLSMVWLMYPWISDVNERNEDKVYTNVIWLFNEWRGRLSEIKGKAEKKKQICRKKAARAEAKAERANQKAEQQKAKEKYITADVFSGDPLK